jgi:hypothetical protein
MGSRVIFEDAHEAAESSAVRVYIFARLRPELHIDAGAGLGRKLNDGESVIADAPHVDGLCDGGRFRPSTCSADEGRVIWSAFDAQGRWMVS